MEIIKKTIFQAITTGTTTGCTENCCVIIPDLTKEYYIKFCLTQDTHEIGFLDVYVEQIYYYGYYGNDAIPLGLGNLY